MALRAAGHGASGLSQKGDRMDQTGFSIATVAALAVAAVIAAIGIYLYQRKGSGDTVRLFSSRQRPRLALVERTILSGGRKLLLIRRDDVEHLILVGGPIDLVVESGIHSEKMAGAAAKEEKPARVGDSVQDWPSVWPLADSPHGIKAAAPAEPRFQLSPQKREGTHRQAEEEEIALTLTPQQEAKAAE